MRVIVPFDPSNPNSRLAAVLSPDERRDFAEVMLADVLRTVREAGGSPAVLSTAPVDVDAPVTVDDRSLSVGVNDALAESLPTAVVMADLALATPESLEALFATDGDVVIAPGRGGGTNALVVRAEAFAVDYHGVSFRDHVAAAEGVDADLATVDSFHLAVDVDERADLLDVLVHGEGPAVEWLRDAGFRVESEEGAPRVVREPNA